MKQNTAESPEILIQSFTEGDDWAAAKWGATVFRYDPAGLPEIGLAFDDLDAGRRIFNSWIERFGHIDNHEELRVSIIEGPIPSDSDGYTVFISSNPPNTIRRKQFDDPDFKPTRSVRHGRFNRMHPAPGSHHLRLFKEHFARVRRYRLFPARFQGSQLTELAASRYIEKQELNFLRACDLTPRDLEYAAVTAKHEPIP